MNILLTGATGFLGYRILEVLVNNPKIKLIIANGRSLMPSRRVTHNKVKYFLGDLSKIDFVNSLPNDIDVVINTASLSSPWGNRELFYKSNVITQKNIINYSKLNNINKIIYISSPSIYYNGSDRFLVKESERLPAKFVNHYSTTKRDAEILLEDSNLDYIIIRPRAIIGRGDTVIMPRLINAHKEQKLKIIGSGNNLVDLTSVANVVSAVELSIFATSKAINQTYNITDGNPVSLWESVNTVFKGIGLQPIVNKVNFFTAYFVAYIMEISASFLFKEKEPSLTKYSVGVLSKNFTLDISKAKELLNYKPIISTNESINEFLDWYNHKNKNEEN